MGSTFRAAVESKDLQRILGMLADDVVFRSPAVHKPYHGKEATSQLLSAVFRLFEDFHYLAEFASDDGEVLLFQARVGSRDIQGVDVLRLNDEGRVAELTVMIRPLSGLNAVVEGMTALLSGGSA